MADRSMKFVKRHSELMENAWTLADAIHDGTVDAREGGELVAKGKVFLPFRYGRGLAFAPAKFIGYKSNSFSKYRSSVRKRSGSLARVAITRLLDAKATEDAGLEERLKNYCLQIGVSLAGNKHSFWQPVDGTDTRDRSAIDDIDAPGIGNDDPEYRQRMAGSYVRNQKVREAVLDHADGRCEYCSVEGFETPSGRRYLEAHHVISLSEQGPDLPSNVIALCATDHRRAHFSVEWAALQEEFLTIIAARSPR